MPLVTRDHPKLTLEGARAVLAAAQRRAQEISVPMNVAVVDDGGHLLAFERMDGARPSSIAISLVKAQAAAVTDSYNDEGFAKAMEAFILGSAR